jgi:predicted SAM-dependent methyltransferase
MPLRSFAELQAARNLPGETTPAHGISESAGDKGGVSPGGVAPLKLNLASGQRPFSPPWVNVDIQSKWEPDKIPTPEQVFQWFVKADMRNMPMFRDNSADMIVIHHGLEHCTMSDADSVLRESYRILQPGGSLIITLPDMKALSNAWLSGEISDYIFFVNAMGADMGDPADLHRWHYTHDGLMEKMFTERTPWSTMKRFDWREIPGASIARDWWIQGTEAIK